MQIEIPIPRANVPGSCARYPFDRIEVGDSFIVPTQRASLLTIRGVVRARNAKGAGLFSVSEAADGRTIVERVE